MQPTPLSSIPPHGLAARGLACVRDDRILFENLDFDLTPGQILQVEGHNGSGKTSLLRILCGLALPAEGTVYWNGQDILQDRLRYQAELAYLGHAHGVKAELTALENLRLSLALRNHPPLDLAEVLARVGLRGFEDVPARALSAGQQRRVSLARLLLSQAQVWILDEPFTSLDKAGIAYVESLLAEHEARGGMAALTSHHPVRHPNLLRIYLGKH